MKKGRLLNSELSGLIASLGHGQSVTVADAGLPIPPGSHRIDLALTEGVPGFLETLEVLLAEMQVESVIIAEEMASTSPELYQALMSRIGQLSSDQGQLVEVLKVSHEAFKVATKDSMGIVRTGEFTPYAKIILESGVVF